MPLPVNVQSGTRRSVRGLFGRVLQRPDRAARHPDPPVVNSRVDLEGAAVIDADTRTFWARGETAVDSPDPSALPSRRSEARERISALLHAHETGHLGTTSRPRGNPAFSEALFVELMRARQYKRAFEQLSSECRRRWGSADRFAAAQDGAVRWLRGVQVKDVRFLSEWTDPDQGRKYTDVAELEVEYTLGDETTAKVLPRVVHLVPDGGKWRSLCYPV